MKPLVVENVTKNFGGLQALCNINIQIDYGERRVVIGPNGAGKTTFFNIISGMIAPSNGRIFIFGKDVTTMPPHKRVTLGLGRTFQITNLFPKLTVMENLLLSVKSMDTTKVFFLKPITSLRHLTSCVEGLLDQLGLWDKRDVSVCNLAYGEQRRLEIIMAMAQNPKLLLLDEFTSGLSMEEINVVTSMLKSLTKDITLLIIEHDMDVAFELGEKFTVLHMGEVLVEGFRNEIKGNPQIQEIYLGKEE